jgi:hypothetical protein
MYTRKVDWSEREWGKPLEGEVYADTIRQKASYVGNDFEIIEYGMGPFFRVVINGITMVSGLQSESYAKVIVDDFIDSFIPPNSVAFITDRESLRVDDEVTIKYGVALRGG